jgi:hypothetical protein
MSNADGQHTATVETLTAEVRVLMVGSRQVTMSVYNQLDWAELTKLDGLPFGRVHPRDAERRTLYLVGRHQPTGALVRTRVINPDHIAKKYANNRYGFEPQQLPGPGAAAKELSNHVYGEPDFRYHGWGDTNWPTAHEVWAQLVSLPLIVLAGLR